MNAADMAAAAAAQEAACRPFMNVTEDTSGRTTVGPAGVECGKGAWRGAGLCVVCGEEGAEDGDAEGSADLADQVVGGGPGAGPFAGHRSQDSLGGGCGREPCAEAGDQLVAERGTVSGGGLGQGQESEPGRDQQHPRGDGKPVAPAWCDQQLSCLPPHPEPQPAAAAVRSGRG